MHVMLRESILSFIVFIQFPMKYIHFAKHVKITNKVKKRLHINRFQIHYLLVLILEG